MQKVSPFLMFQNGEAEQAIRWYASAIQPSEVHPVGPHGVWRFTLKGLSLIAFDSPVKHQFGFTPAVSLYVACESADEVDRITGELSQGGTVLMELGSYPFSERYCWFNDKYGVSWQVALVREEA